jgi:hypothetical protein
MAQDIKDTTATNATLTEDGQPIGFCAFGSTQYVNAISSQQDLGRYVMSSYSAVFIIPQKPLNSGKTYAVSVDVNGQPVKWSFQTSTTFRTQK